MTTTIQSNKPGFLARLFLAFFKLIILVIVLAALAVGGWFAYKEIDRSFDSVVTRMDINTRHIEQTDSEIDDLLAKINEQHDEIMALQTAVATQNEHIADLTAELAAEQTQQGNMLAALDTQVSGNIANDIAALNEGLVALQSDITNNRVQIDELGGAADGLQGAVTNLNAQIKETQTALAEFPAAEIVRMRQTLTLFRLWELTTRARLHLVEGNAGLAAADVELALANLNQMLENDSDDELTTLALPVQERLVLAAASLPDEPETAVRDLETAWETIDEALARLLEGTDKQDAE